MKDKLYFIDYSCAAMLPCSGRADLVKEYEKLMAENDETLLGTYKTELALMRECAKWANQAEDGCEDLEEFTDAEMRGKILDVQMELKKKDEKSKLSPVHMLSDDQLASMGLRRI